MDEARNDSLYELEIAFKELRSTIDLRGALSRGAPAVRPFPPGWWIGCFGICWVFDSPGNTHRTEFCIHKLFSPDSSTGRLGLLELRAFEMPPHARMESYAEPFPSFDHCTFLEGAYERSLVRWSTELHDRFMLPHFAEQDFQDVIEDLNDAGYRLKHEWFAPHFEFRFSKFGDVTYRGVNLEIRQALEPWHVLGEQGAAGSTVRYVDSSLERLQVKVRGLIDTRHALTANGRRVPLHPTGTEGEYVAGVRFRAWQPPECLQPTIRDPRPANL